MAGGQSTGRSGAETSLARPTVGSGSLPTDCARCQCATEGRIDTGRINVMFGRDRSVAEAFPEAEVATLADSPPMWQPGVWDSAADIVLREPVGRNSTSIGADHANNR